MRKILPITVTLGLSMFSLNAPLAAQEVSKEVLSIAAKVHTGALVCEDRKMIMLWPDTALPGRFILKMNKRVYKTAAKHIPASARPDLLEANSNNR
ncbi:MAG: hypothetical protein EBT28_03445 [Betaproteobacteria bacterium]|nr:hypothetical protein [Betaproteobacteria bacterium]